MSRNGSGTYTLPAGNPVVTGTTITTAWANTTLTDIASALTASVAADGQTPMSGSLNLANNKIISVTDPTSAQDAATKAYADALIAGTKTGLFTSVTDSGLTSGRVTYATTGGLLTDDADLTFDGTTLTAAKGANFCTTSGTVGIGGTSTGAQLYQYLASGTTQRSIVNGSVIVLEYVSTAGAQGVYGTYSNHSLVFTTNNTQVAALTTAGVFLVGCTATPNVGTTGEYGFSTSSNEVVISKNTSGTTPAVFIRTNAGASKTAISFYNDTTQVGAITTTTAATAYVTSSDYRLKDDVTPMTGALATVSQLKPVTYKWKADGSNGQGFIAHELQAVVPDCVVGEKDAVNAEGKPVYQGIDTSFLVATLTAAIQELKAEFDTYKASHP
jgi:hypothetical protein